MKKQLICSLFLVLVLALMCAVFVFAAESTDVVQLPTAVVSDETVYMISDAEEFYAFSELVDQGEDFSGETVYLIASISIENFESISGTFRGKFNALGNSITLSGELSSALFKKLEGARVSDLHIVIAENTKLATEDVLTAIIAESATDSSFDSCSVSGNIIVEAVQRDDGGDQSTESQSTMQTLEPERPETSETPDNTQDSDSSEEPVITQETQNTESSENTENPATSENTKENEFSQTEAQPVAFQLSLNLAPFVATAENCEFYNCCSATQSNVSQAAFVLEAIDCDFVNVMQESSPCLVQTAQNCTFSNILSFVPVTEEGVIVFDGESSAEAVVEELNTGRTDPEREQMWIVSDSNPALHMHIYVMTEIEKSCISYAKKEYKCECGSVALIIEDADGGYADHIKSDGGTVVAPTCTEEGYTEHTCALCEEIFKTELTKATGHKTETVGKIDATCVDKGYTGDKVCKNCSTVVSKGKNTSATGEHRWSNPKVTKEPTADTDGEVVYSCAYCDATRAESIAATGHTRGEFEYFDETYHSTDCSCGDVIKEEHDYKLIGVVREPTPDEDGATLYRCSICRGEKEVPIPATGHSISKWMPNDNDTHIGNCSCGEAETEAHTWDTGTLVSDGISDKTGVEKTLFACTVCGFDKVTERKVDLPFDTEEQKNEEKIRVYALAVITLLVVGGVFAYVYIRFTDRR